MTDIYTLAKILPGSHTIWQILNALSHKYAAPFLPAQSLPRGLSASGSMIDAGVLVGSHGHVGSLQTQSPAKTTLL